MEALLRYGLWWENYNLDSAAACYKQAGVLAIKSNDMQGRFRYYSNYTYILNQQGKLKQGLRLNLEALSLARKIGTKQQLADCLFNAGSSYNNLGMYNEALDLYLQAAEKLEALRDDKMLSVVYDNLGGVYTNSFQFEKALQYHRQAFQLAERLRDKQAMAKILVNKGITELALKQLGSAKNDLNKGLEWSIKIRNPYIESIAYKSLADWYIETGNPDQALVSARKAYQLAVHVKSNYAQYEALKVLTASFDEKNEPDSVIRYGKQALDFGKENQFTTDRYKLLDLLAKSWEKKGDLKQALNDYKQFKQLHDSILLSGEKIKMQRIQNDYQKAKSQNEIFHLQSAQKKQQLVIWSLIITTIVLGIFAFLLFKVNKSRHRMIEQEIISLKQEEDLKAAQLILETQEEERLRIAKDLHDGLGGLLSGIKLTIQNAEQLKENEQKALKQLDDAMTEMRRISHSMIPEALSKFGLADALGDMCRSLESAGKFRMSCQFFGLEERLSSELETNLYRIVLELINNAVKHAEASEIYLQLLQQDQLLTVTIEDNGKGFEPEILDRASGMGYKNIQSRLKLIRGNWEIHSEPGKGTSIHLEINVSS